MTGTAIRPQDRPSAGVLSRDAASSPPAAAGSGPGRYRPDRAVRRYAVAGVLTVAAVAAVVSYQHAYEVALSAGESRLSAAILPLSIDGAVLAGSMGLLADSRAGRPASRLAWCLLVLGAVATLCANIAAAEDNWTARIVAGWPAVAFVLAVETLLSMVRRAGTSAKVGEKSIGSEPARRVAASTARPNGTGRPVKASDGTGGRPSPRPGGLGGAGTAGATGQRSDAELVALARSSGLEAASADRLVAELRIGKGRAVRLRKQLAGDLIPASGNGHHHEGRTP